MAMNEKQLTALQSSGLRWMEAMPTGLSRQGGAGPTDHKALSFAGQTAMVPIFNPRSKASPFRAQWSDDREQVLVFEGDRLLERASVPGEPNFYRLRTADGIPYAQIATLHSRDVLATTVLQECVRYRNRETSCQFCAIEESLKNGKTIARKRPEQLAEVARAAVALDGVTQMIMTTGTPKTLDRGAAILAESARAVKTAVDLPIQAQCEPPADDHWFATMKDAGIDALGMHLEAVTDRVRRRIMPGKATVSLSRYFAAYRAAVEVFGRGNVSTYILAGLGDTEAEIIAVSRQLIDLGVYPFIVPFVPVAGTPLADHPPPDAAMLHRIFAELGPLLAARRMTSESLRAGCAKCGACSSLKSYEKSPATTVADKPGQAMEVRRA